MTNLGIATWSCRLIHNRITNILLVHVPVVLLGATIGSWLFFVQHQYEERIGSRRSLGLCSLAFEGSSYYRLPRVLQWFTGNIGFHHIHHLESRIPNYNLPICYAVVPELRQAVTLNLRDSFRSIGLKLWDEQLQRMVTFEAAASWNASRNSELIADHKL